MPITKRQRNSESDKRNNRFSRHFMMGLTCVRLHKQSLVSAVRLPRKHMHNQKHCCWLSKWYFRHWILVDPQLRLDKLWRSHLLYDKATEYYRMFKALQSFFYTPVLLWPHISIDNCTLLPLTPSSLLQSFTLKVQCHLLLYTIYFPKKSALVPSKPTRSIIFLFSNTDVLCCLMAFAPHWEVSKCSQSCFFSLFQFLPRPGHYKNTDMSRLLVTLTLPDAAHGFLTSSQLPGPIAWL